MESQCVHVEVRGQTGLIRLTRPEALNALSSDLLDQLDAAVRNLATRVSCILVSADGPCFSVGADLKEVGSRLGSRQDLREQLIRFHQVTSTIEECEVPVIVAAHGYLLAGGLEIALAADILLVSHDAQIGDQHIRVGLIPGGGGSQRLPRAIGDRRSRALQLTGARISGRTAVQWGLAHDSVPEHLLGTTADALADAIAAGSRSALVRIKRLARTATESALSDGLELELELVLDHLMEPPTMAVVEAFVARTADSVHGGSKFSSGPIQGNK